MQNLDLTSILIGAVISAIIAVAVTRYYAAKKKICFLQKINVALDPKPESLPTQVRILFDDREIQNLHRVDFAFWNGGNRELLSTDFIDEHQILVKVQGAEILEALSIEQNRKTIGADIQPLDSSTMKLTVNNFNPRDYVIVTLLLEKTGDEPISCVAEAEVVGMPDGISTIDEPGINSWGDVFAFAFIGVAFGFFAFQIFTFIVEGILDWPFAISTGIAEKFGNNSLIEGVVNSIFMIVLLTIFLFCAIFSFIGVYFILFYRIFLPSPIRRHFGIKNQITKFRSAISSTSKEVAS